MKIRNVFLAACVGTMTLVLTAVMGAFAQGVVINNDGLFDVNKRNPQTGTALPKTQQQQGGSNDAIRDGGRSKVNTNNGTGGLFNTPNFGMEFRR